MGLSSHPNEELMMNKEGKAKTFPLVSRKAQGKQGSFLLYSHT